MSLTTFHVSKGVAAIFNFFSVEHFSLREIWCRSIIAEKEIKTNIVFVGFCCFENGDYFCFRCYDFKHFVPIPLWNSSAAKNRIYLEADAYLRISFRVDSECEHFSRAQTPFFSQSLEFTSTSDTMWHTNDLAHFYWFT